MARGFVLGIMLIFLAQAERVCCRAWSKEAKGFQNGNRHAGSRVDGLGKFSYPLSQVRRVLVLPRLIQSGSSNTRSAVDGGSGQGLSTMGYLQAPSSAWNSAQNSPRLIQSRSSNTRSVVDDGPGQGLSTMGYLQALSSAQHSIQSSARLVSSRLKSTLNRLRPASLRADAHPEPRSLGRMPAQQGAQQSSSKSARIPSRNLYSSPASGQSAAQKTPNFKKMGVSAFLFGQAAPKPRGNYVQMRTYASAPAKKVSSSLRSLRPRSWRPVYKPSYSSEVYNLAVPRSSTVGGPGTVYNIPNRYGGFAIRRVKEPEVQQISPPRQWMAAYNPSLSKSKWNKI